MKIRSVGIVVVLCAVISGPWAHAAGSGQQGDGAKPVVIAVKFHAE